MLSALSFANPSGAWAFLAVAAVAALYLFRRRRRPRAATGLFLWGMPERSAEGGRRAERLFADRSFRFDLIAAALLALALTEPAWQRRERTRVIILDDSIGMLSRGNWREAARIAADAAASSRQAAVVLAGERPRTGRALGPGGGGDFAAWLERGYFPAGRSGDLGEAIAFAREVYGGGAEHHLISNREDAAAFADAGVTVRLLAGRGDNLAFGRIWRRAAGEDGRGEAEETLFLGIENFGEATDAVLSVSAVETETPEAEIPGAAPANAPLVSRALRLAPGSSRLALPLAGHARALLRVELRGEGDCIAQDSAAFVPPDSATPLTAAVRGLPADARRAVETALRAAGCVVVGDEAPAELLATSDKTAKGGVATLRFPEADNPATAFPPFLTDHADPLCRDVDLSGVAWTLAAPAHAARADAALIAAGDLPLFWREGEGGFLLNLLPARGTLARHPAWPVLMANICAEVETLRRGVAKRWFFPGETVPVRGGRAALLRGGELVAETSGGAFRAPGAAGLYRLVVSGAAAGKESVAGEGGEGELVAVLPLYGNASDARALSDRAATLRGAAGLREAEGRMDLRWALFLCAAVLLGCNYHRKK